jgi:shikimate dehydrogenase
MAMDRYAVMGHPVGHSKSPRIHQAFAEQTGQALEYTAIPVEPGHFPEAVARFRAEGGRGLNVTLPFKEDAFELAERVTERARRAGAVNTLTLGDDGVAGDNTDGIGLVRDLTANLGCPLVGRRVLLVGAGGAARGVLGPLLEQWPERVVVANRTASRAAGLAREAADVGDVTGCGLEDLAGLRFHLVVNATAASLEAQVPALPEDLFEAGAWAYDMMYGAEPTPFMTWAAQRGAAHQADGLGMLVEQAAESFRIWRGMRPATAPVIALLRARGTPGRIGDD